MQHSPECDLAVRLICISAAAFPPVNVTTPVPNAKEQNYHFFRPLLLLLNSSVLFLSDPGPVIVQACHFSWAFPPVNVTTHQCQMQRNRITIFQATATAFELLQYGFMHYLLEPPLKVIPHSILGIVVICGITIISNID